MKDLENHEPDRFHRAFAVSIVSETFGQSFAIARKISNETILLETSDPFPLGTLVSLQFTIPEAHSSVVKKGEVKRHYFLNFISKGKPRCFTGIGVRLTTTEATPEEVFSPHQNTAIFVH